ncbi:MAG: 2'-5' RNA ligase, partial [Nitrospinae bacterium RIFCSPLOWO2_12_FULL_47_7]
HLTLKFLGNVNSDRIPVIKERLKVALASVPRFLTSVGGVGVFPAPERPRVLWVGLENTSSLADLQKKVDVALEQVGFKPETKIFSAHLTLGRIKSGQTVLQNALEKTQKIESGPFEISAVTLYESQLTREGSIYTVLEEFKLDAPA